MSSIKNTNIKNVLKNHPHNTILTAQGLLNQGVSRDLQRSAVRSGWFTRIGHGAYTVLDEPVDLDGALYTLQRELDLKIHQGGFSVLHEKYGKTHNIPISRHKQLFSYRGERIPTWFKEKYGDSYDLVKTSFLPPAVGLIDYENMNFTVRISSIERAVLEMLYLTPSAHTLHESYQILELITVIKPELMMELLECCSSIKVKRLFLYMAERLDFPWFRRIGISKIDLGSGVREISKGGQYDKKYGIVIEKIEEI